MHAHAHGWTGTLGAAAEWRVAEAARQSLLRSASEQTECRARHAVERLRLQVRRWQWYTTDILVAMPSAGLGAVRMLAGSALHATLANDAGRRTNACLQDQRISVLTGQLDVLSRDMVTLQVAASTAGVAATCHKTRADMLTLQLEVGLGCWVAGQVDAPARCLHGGGCCVLQFWAHAPLQAELILAANALQAAMTEGGELQAQLAAALLEAGGTASATAGTSTAEAVRQRDVELLQHFDRHTAQLVGSCQGDTQDKLMALAREVRQRAMHNLRWHHQHAVQHSGAGPSRRHRPGTLDGVPMLTIGASHAYHRRSSLSLMQRSRSPACPNPRRSAPSS
jgi:hypothetical protein